MDDEVRAEGPFGIGIKARGPNASLSVLIVLCAVSLVGFGYVHHTEEKAGVDELKATMGEVVYMLSLKQEDREKLQLTMPDSLRGKTRHHREPD